jgi:uncharacterized protein (DUF924 family)
MQIAAQPNERAEPLTGPIQVLDFWFGPPGSPEFGKPRACWFAQDPAFDAEVRERGEAIWHAAVGGDLSAWRDNPLTVLAMTIILDQFPRNLFRGTGQAFASDAQALEVASGAIDAGFDRLLLPVQRWFLYLPFEHAEDLAAQRRSVALFATLRGDPASATAIDYAARHLAVIERFGRFPHRNAPLGRESTPEELSFLAEPGSRF